MNVASYFSGVGGLDLGLERAGLRVVSQCEADPWRRRVLAARFPGVPISDDVRAELARPRWGRDARAGRLGERASGERRIEPVVHLVCGGVPCQDWSVAGKRAGIKGKRSGRFFDWRDRIADFVVRPRWLLFENVPGLLSAADGRDFAVVLRSLADLGYGLAWRVLDGRYFGVPQRRRRVFVVGHSGGDPGPAARALLEGGGWDLEAGECSWQAAARRVGGGVAGDGRVSPAVTAKWRKGSGGPAGDECQNLVGVSVAQNQRGELRESDIAPQLTTGGKPGEGYPAVRIEGPMAFRPTGGSQGVEAGPLSPALKVGSGVGIPSPPGVLTPALTASNDQSRSPQSAEVTRQVDAVRLRRLSPVECERLMSWPDNWTAIDGPDTPWGKRYAACGDGVISNVSEWIARRILAADKEAAA